MRRTAGQRGSALLIVFVFAAVIAILLYREMPVAVFEAHRQKEELLIDRGNEYKHAIKLYVRKSGTFPPSIEALENTNRMRFLRHKFDDPFTGKDDWRILHAGPGGMIVDSKVNTNKNGLDANGKPLAGNAGTSGSNSNSGIGGFGSNNSSNNSPSNNLSSNPGGNSIFGQKSSGFGSNSDSSSDTPEVTVAAVPQRAPAIASNGSSAAAPNNDLPALPSESAQSIPAPQGAAVPADSAGVGATPVAATGNPQDPQTLMRSMLNNPQNPQAPQGQQGQQPSNRMGTIASGGGIAGVASRASGHSIKLVNDQDNYSLWEFFYDMTKEANTALAAAQGRGGATPANPSGNGFGQSNQSNSFGQSNQSNGFGQSNQSNGFSLSNNNSNSNSMSGPGPTPAIGTPQVPPNQ